jgi:hypothetical protein
MELMTRSAYAFCQGERGAVRTSWIPIRSAWSNRGKGVITIADEITRDFVPRKRFAELLGGPRRRGMGGDGHMHDTSTLWEQTEHPFSRRAVERRFELELGPIADGRITGACGSLVLMSVACRSSGCGARDQVLA